MTVLRMNSSGEYASPRRGRFFADPRPRNAWSVPAACPRQDWTRRLEVHSSRRRDVISERRSALPVFSAKGIRWDVLMTVLLLLLLFFAGILLADVEALSAGGVRIGRLSAGIESLENRNSLLREELYSSSNYSLLRSSAEGPITESRLLTIQTAPSEE